MGLKLSTAEDRVVMEVLTDKMLPSCFFTRLWKSFSPRLSFPREDFRYTVTSDLMADSISRQREARRIEQRTEKER